jgi:uncharacterized protein YidB (DUF937 family)
MATNDPLDGLGELGQLLGGLSGGSGAAGQGGLPSGLGAALGGLLGGAAGGPAGTGTGMAGLENLINGFQQAGLGEQVQSWIGTGANLPVTPEQIGAALGPDKVKELVGSTGLDIGQLLPMLAAFLPQIVNALTPHGQVPQPGAGENPLDALGGLLKGLGG